MNTRHRPWFRSWLIICPVICRRIAYLHLTFPRQRGLRLFGKARVLPGGAFWRVALLSALYGAVSACATPEGGTGNDFRFPGFQRGGTVPPTTVTSDYLKGRFAARYKALDVAADAYSRASGAVPDDLNMVRHAFFYDLAAGRPEEALERARTLSRLARPGTGTEDTASAVGGRTGKPGQTITDETITDQAITDQAITDQVDTDQVDTDQADGEQNDALAAPADGSLDDSPGASAGGRLEEGSPDSRPQGHSDGADAADSDAPDSDVPDSDVLVGVLGVLQSGADLPVLLKIADAFVRRDHAEAEALLQRDFSNVYNESLAHLLRVWLALEADDALAALKVIQSDRPGLFTGFSTLHQGYLLELAREPEEARKAYEAAAEGFNAPTALHSFASFLEREARKNPDLVPEALAVHRNLAIQAGPLRRLGRLALARMGEKEPGATRGFSRSAARLPPRQVDSGRKGAARAFYHFAQSSLEQALAERAALRQLRLRPSSFSPLNTPLALAQIALYLDPDLHAARYLVGSIYVDFGMNETAVAAYGKIPFASAYYVHAQLGSIQGLEALGRESDAHRALKRLLEGDPNLPEAVLTYAEILVQEERYAAARAQLARLIAHVETLPENDALSRSLWRLYFARGAFEAEQGNWDEGEDDLKAAVTLAPEEPLVLNYLGYSWVERGVNLTEAFEMIEKAVKLRPRSGAIVDSLGWAFYQLGEYQEAAKHLERAVGFEPADPTVTEHLGDVYWQLDRKIEAKYQWRHVLTLAPGEEFEARIRGKIAHGLDGSAVPGEAF